MQRDLVNRQVCLIFWVGLVKSSQSTINYVRLNFLLNIYFGSQENTRNSFASSAKYPAALGLFEFRRTAF